MAVSQISDIKTYLSFILDSEDFAVDVTHVREVLDFTSVTRIPRTPDFMKGVINLRGGVVPVVDMRLKFGLPETPPTVDTCVVVLELTVEGELVVIGALCDSVKEVFQLDPEEIEPPPRFGTRFNVDFVSGMGKQDEHFIIILDIDRIFSEDELLTMGVHDETSSPVVLPGDTGERTESTNI